MSSAHKSSLIIGLLLLGGSLAACDSGGDEVVFRITNNSTKGCRIAVVDVFRNSTAAQYGQSCSIPVGATVEVRVKIPAADTYDVMINGANNEWSLEDWWYATMLRPGETYDVVIGPNATLDGVPCAVCDI